MSRVYKSIVTFTVAVFCLATCTTALGEVEVIPVNPNTVLIAVGEIITCEDEYSITTEAPEFTPSTTRETHHVLTLKIIYQNLLLENTAPSGFITAKVTYREKWEFPLDYVRYEYVEDRTVEVNPELEIEPLVEIVLVFNCEVPNIVATDDQLLELTLSIENDNYRVALR